MQRFQSILQFKKVSCKNCYKCVRNCPVKAIRVHDHQARIIESQCIYCEKCILVCPQDAKEEQNMIPAIRSAMENKAQVVASLHPAYLARFGVTGINGIREAMKKLGFATAAMALREDTVNITDPGLNREKKLAVILGTEGEGLKQETIEESDYTIRIPMAHGVDSLNVAAASAVAFWQLGKKS